MKNILMTLLVAQIAHAGNIESDSKSAVKSLAITIGASYATYQVMEKICPQTGGQWACPMAVMAAGQGVASIATQQGARRTNSASACTGRDCYGSPGFDPVTGQPIVPIDTNGDGVPDNPYAGFDNTAADRLLDRYEREMRDSQARLASQGYKLNPDGSVTMPNGKTVNAASLGSGSEAGFSPSQMADMQKALAAADKLGKSKASDLEKLLGAALADAGASQTIRNKKFVGGDEFDMNKYLKGLNGRGPASVDAMAGLSKNIGQDAVGVAGDNIFKMINRQYDNQRAKDSFLPK